MERDPHQATPTSFWRRQFSDSPTRRQTIFDLIAGVILPTLCLIFDPIIFKSKVPIDCDDGTPRPILSPERLAIFAYTLIGLGMLALLIWLIAGKRSPRYAVCFAGIFFAGAVSAAILGLLLLPFSLIGLLLYGLGVLGFIPFLTMIVYLRNGVRAWRLARQQEPSQPRKWLIALALTTALLIYVVPAFVQWQVWLAFPQTYALAQLPPCQND